MVFTLGKLERLICDRHIVLGSWKITTLELNVNGTKRDVTPKKRPDRFPSIRDHIQVTPTFELTWATPRHTVIGGS